VIALAVQDVTQARTMADLVRAEYPLLADADHAVAGAYGVYNLLGDGLATPAVFIIDRAGRVSWSYVGKNTEDRPSADDILSHLP
jgi:peroxiredoxin